MIESEKNKMIYTTGDNSVFPFPLRILDPTDLHVFCGDGKTETELTYGTDFTVEVPDPDHGATVTVLKPIAKKQTLTIMRICGQTQSLALPEYGKLPSRSLETALDKLTMICQQIAEKVTRTLTVKPTDPKTSEQVLSELYNAQSIAGAEADRAERAANTALVNGEREVQKAKYWAEVAKDTVVSGEVTYDELGSEVIITPDVVYEEDEILYDIVEDTTNG